MTSISLKRLPTSRRWLVAHALLFSAVAPINAWIVPPPVFDPRNPMPPQYSFFPDEPMGARNSGLYGRIGQDEPFVHLMQDWKPSVGPFFNNPEPREWREPNNGHYQAPEHMPSSSPYYREHQVQQPLGPNAWGNPAAGSYGSSFAPMGLLPGGDVRSQSPNNDSWNTQRPNKSPWPESSPHSWPNSGVNPASSQQWMNEEQNRPYGRPPNMMEEPPQGYGYGHWRTFDPRSPLGYQSNYPRSQWPHRDEPMFNDAPWQAVRYYDSHYASVGADEPWGKSWNMQHEKTSIWEGPSHSSSSFGSGSFYSQSGAYDPNSFDGSSRSGSSTNYDKQSGKTSSKVIEPEFYVESERNKRQRNREAAAFTQRTVAPTNGVVGMPSTFQSYLDTLSPRSFSAGRWKGPNFMPYKGPQH
ncbi:hypothetical protein FisN_23Lh001 [Fistulifera solaris]|uniref:Uncharacterized protein n=1 Tax=Fistulifera solaris TaxID=1519565 RepID=A0A1Z5KJU9_FISSO|nr:hypothetical protein FisN_23Lh001 [Fistulifera solaris]|eukprot:GAX26477.1 hypothetical protein FisN_23Lh001 [Fistulifera solaris]